MAAPQSAYGRTHDGRASAPFTVGYALNPKKTHTFDTRGLFFPLDPSTSFVPLDPSLSLDPQGPFDVLLIKLTDAMVAHRHSPSPSTALLFHHITDYLRRHPACVIIDELSAVERVLDRAVINDAIRLARVEEAGWTVEAPEAVVVEVRDGETATATVAFPVICKPLPSCGSSSSHTFFVLSCPQQMAALPAGTYLVQRLVPHAGVLYKVYVLGSASYIVPKPSLPPALTRPSSSSLPPLVLDSQTMLLTTLSGEPFTAPPPSPLLALDKATAAAVERVSVRLAAVFGLTLFGYDVLLPEEDRGEEEEGEGGEGAGKAGRRRLVVVDVNYFPSYNRVEGLSEKLLRVIRERHAKETTARATEAVRQCRYQ